MSEAVTSETMSTALARVRERARKVPRGKMFSLCHHIDVEALRRAFHRIRKSAAVGVDGVTVEDYEQDLERRLTDVRRNHKAHLG